MIVRGTPRFRDVLFATRGSILHRIVWPLVVMACASVFAVALHAARPAWFSGLAAVPFTLIGLSLSIFMSFRNTVCYGRWWEGRQLWGRMIIATRSFARQTATLPAGARGALLLDLCGFAGGLAARLRGQDEPAAIARYSPDGPWRTAPNPTDAVLARIGRRCRELVAEGALDSMHCSLLETQLTELTVVQGGCERIKYTPVPFSYSLMLHRTAHAFCLLLPFALAPVLGWWTPLPTLLVSYAFFGLDALGDELSDPFGMEPNDLPLDAIVRIIERDMLHAMGRTDLPPVLEAKDYVLM